MQIQVEKSDDLERKMTVSVPEDRIAGQVKDRLQELVRTVKIDGFRPGKVPMGVVKRRFGSRVREEVMGEVLRTTFTEALTQEELRPVGEPSIEPGEIEPGKGMSYTATFEVYPAVEIAPVEQLTIERPVCDIGDDDLNKMIETLKDQNKTWKPVERGSADGDQVTIDFEGKIDDEVFEGGTAEDFDLVLGLGHMIDGFEEGLMGQSAGTDTVLDLKFPDNYQAEHLAGKDVQFKITLKQVSEAELPALNDEFFAKFGVEEGGEEAFRKEVRDNMERERDRALQRQFNTAVLDNVAAANDLALPKALVAAETQRMQQQALQSMLQRGAPPGDLDPAGMAAMFEEPAQKRVKLGLLMAEMIKNAGITADPAKVRETIESMASSYEDSAAVVKWYYEDPQRLQEIEAMCLEDEAVTWIVERATVTETPISFDDLMNPVQTDE